MPDKIGNSRAGMARQPRQGLDDSPAEGGGGTAPPAYDSTTGEKVARGAAEFAAGVAGVGIAAPRPPTAAEMARDAGLFPPRTTAIGSTPEGEQNPLWSAEEFNGKWFICWPIACASVNQTNVGEDGIKMQAMCCLCYPATTEFARMGNTNRFGATSYTTDDDGSSSRSEDVLNFTSTTSLKHEGGGIPGVGWKSK